MPRTIMTERLDPYLHDRILSPRAGVLHRAAILRPLPWQICVYPVRTVNHAGFPRVLPDGHVVFYPERRGKKKKYDRELEYGVIG